MTQDEHYLKILSIFHYVVGGIIGLFACIPIVYIAFGLLVILTPAKIEPREPPPALFGWFFVIFGAVMMLIGWAFAICVLLVGRFLARRKHYFYCLVMAGIECIFMPFGTVLGVFTIIVLIKEPVKEMFGIKAGN